MAIILIFLILTIFLLVTTSTLVTIAIAYQIILPVDETGKMLKNRKSQLGKFDSVKFARLLEQIASLKKLPEEIDFQDN